MSSGEGPAQEVYDAVRLSHSHSFVESTKMLKILSNVRNAKAVWGMNSVQYQASASIAAEYLQSMQLKFNGSSTNSVMDRRINELRDLLEGFSLQ